MLVDPDILIPYINDILIISTQCQVSTSGANDTLDFNLGQIYKKNKCVLGNGSENFR